MNIFTKSMILHEAKGDDPLSQLDSAVDKLAASTEETKEQPKDSPTPKDNSEKTESDNKPATDDTKEDTKKDVVDDKPTDDDTKSKYSLGDIDVDEGDEDITPPEDETDDSLMDGVDEVSPPEKNNIPVIEVLNLSDQDKQLNNLKLLRKFKELYKNTENTFNNITSIVTKTPKQTQVIDIVSNNLSMMMDDLKLFMQYKFGNSYETNMVAYLSYIKRYKIALKLVQMVIDEKSR